MLLEIFLISFLVFALAILGMAAGPLLGRPPLSGTCAGRAESASQARCPICGSSKANGNVNLFASDITPAKSGEERT
jgi:hypothetical protein